uniref:CCHC-type domain-containing protein n=1 Tax=Setaria viridis TaxID=4556 RepID=A0A4U6TSB6_SETVI|nr:hypothetical protein SEVIR_8G112200v2 [Setaria viridis]
MVDSVILLITRETRTSRPYHRERGVREQAERPPVLDGAGHEYPVANQREPRPLQLTPHVPRRIYGEVDRGTHEIRALILRSAPEADICLVGPNESDPRAQGRARRSFAAGVGRSRPRSPGSGEAEFSVQGVGNVRPQDTGSGEAERGLSLPYWADGNLATLAAWDGTRSGPVTDSDRRPMGRRGSTLLAHGLLSRHPQLAEGPHKPHSSLVPPTEGTAPSQVTPPGEGWSTAEGKRSRSRRRRRQRRAQRQFEAELYGKCLNCFSSTHLIAQCRRPTRCFRCRDFWHLARDCKRPRSPTSSASSGTSGGPHRFVRTRHDSPPKPRGCDALSRTPSPPSPSIGHTTRGRSSSHQAVRRRASSGMGSFPRSSHHLHMPLPQHPSLPRPPLREGPSGSGADDASDLVLYDDESTLGLPDSRPAEVTCFLSQDELMDAEEERLRFTLLAVAPGAPPNFPLDGLRRALSELPVAGQDNFLIRRFWPENFIISFTAQCARDAALAAGDVPVSGFRFILRPWTCLARVEQRTLFYCVALELDRVPPHAWGCQVVRKVLAPSCWVKRVEEVHADHSDMSKIKKKFLAYDVVIRLRHIADFRSRSPSPSPSPPSSDDSDSGHDGDPDHGHSGNRSHSPVLHGFYTRPGFEDGSCYPGDTGAGPSYRRTAGTPPLSTLTPQARSAPHHEDCAFPPVQQVYSQNKRSPVMMLGQQTTTSMVTTK